jgi:hypothetical protein
MKKMNEAEGWDYEDLGGEVEMELSIFGGFLYIDTPLDRFEINPAELRIDGVPRTVMEYLINERPGERTTIEDIRNGAKIPTSQNLQQMVRKVGFKSSVRDVFIPIFEKDALMVRTHITLPLANARLLIEQLE